MPVLVYSVCSAGLSKKRHAVMFVLAHHNYNVLARNSTFQVHLFNCLDGAPFAQPADRRSPHVGLGADVVASSSTLHHLVHAGATESLL